MKNFELARLFDRMADLLEIKGENPFRIRAYRRAAQSLEGLTQDLDSLAGQGKLEEIPGIGKDLAGKIVEYLHTGRIEALEVARKDIPAGVVELMRVPGVGPKTAKLLYENEGITGIERLEELAKTGKLRGLPGIQAKAEKNILKGIAVVRKGQGRMSLGKALPLAQELVQALEQLPEVKQVVSAGSLRRRKDTVGDLDLLITAEKSAGVMEAFVELPQVVEILEHGSTKASIRHREGIQVDLRVVEPGSFGAALVYFTGSKQHNIRIREMAVTKGLKVSEYGVFRHSTGRRVAGATEEEVYAALGLPWIPPELREDSGEIEAALKDQLPRLVELGDIRGDLHCHTDASDGQYGIEALVEAAAKRGYEYVAVTDHSRSATVAGGLSAEEVLAHARRIRAVQTRHPAITVLAGTECDILPDGSLDYPDELLARLDLVVAAIHSAFKQAKSEMTRRLCKALANPYVHILAHPTGRLIGARDPYDVDLEQVFAAAGRYGKVLEINSQPQRLDLDDVDVRRARDLGIRLAINTDAHRLDDLDTLQLGVATARRGWVEKSDAINTWPVKRLIGWTQGVRGTRRQASRGSSMGRGPT